MILNEFGKICNECWLAIPDHFGNTKLDTYPIMPNHVHGIIVITKRKDGGNGVVGATHASPPHAVPLPNRYGLFKNLRIGLDVF